MSQTPAVEAARAVKPQLRGLHHATIKRNLFVAFGLVTFVTTTFKFLVNEPKKKAYAEFYKTYDAQKSFERMKAAGVFQGVDK
uniref:Putative cytochrome c oxidase subunit vic n=1 Tax=Tabanus bromius TaxID=304241 RepID=A0A0K8TPJ2_TABBR